MGQGETSSARLREDATGSPELASTLRDRTGEGGGTSVEAAATEVGRLETLRSEPVEADRAEGAVQVRSTAPVRTTVLPRVTLEGEGPRLLARERPRFELVRPLGEGGAGEVFAAHDNDIDRLVAVKRMRAQIRSPEALVRFVEEIRTVGRLEHPNVVPIHDVGVDGEGQYYFVMKHVEGETLEALIERLRAGDRETHLRFPFEARVQLFRGLLEAVAFAHSKGVVHRDIKPSNVMVGRFGEVLLMDWGIAKAVDGAASGLEDAAPRGAPGGGEASGRCFETEAGSIVGTPMYMSPEQALGQRVDERSDVYALAVVLHELLTLHHYLEDRRSLPEVIEGVVNHLPGVTSGARSPHQPPVPMDLMRFVRCAMQKEPARRCASVAAMIDRLDRRAEGEIPIDCPVTFARRAALLSVRFVDRHPLLTMALLFGTLAAGLGLGLWALL